MASPAQAPENGPLETRLGAAAAPHGQGTWKQEDSRTAAPSLAYRGPLDRLGNSKIM